MKYRSFQGEQISEVGLGTWQLGSADWGNVSDETAFAILNAYVDAGGNFIDTADVYGMGISETVIGRFLQTRSEPLYVASKLGRRGDGANGWPQNFTLNHMRSAVQDSLRHLQQDQLFLEQLHCIPTETMREGKVFDHLRQLQQEGLIKHFGASVETSEEALICLEQEGLASLQIIFNLFRQHVAEEVFEKAAAKGVALIIRVPLASGLLSGKFSKATTFAPTDHRNFNAEGKAFNAGETFSGVPFDKGVELAQRIASMLPDDRTASWAIRWILDHPQVTTVIPGASKVAQVHSNMLASALAPLAPGVHQQLRKLYDGEIRGIIRGHM
ncbi:Predicted oxidoreductase [Cnuella takakiae]|uniref:Predicted oxidoreductase n=1 Tax=Cnuella takakiae TaxID=1302690 RepID=A0A1M4Y4Z5_9BACT|nr:aldo/keto reductase [Cnuella takakiae]OLY94866.1 aldo/keto reductase [Cnuella takakiae]SHF00778.1 Predicted oxidoreductase [Cnuella takakiae]